MAKKIILKDMLFNSDKISFISNRIKEVYIDFDEEHFNHDVLKKFPDLELKERIFHIRNNLKKYLPNNYKTAVKILIQSLPEELDNKKLDDDFGYFILSPYGEYIAEYGCNDDYLNFSLKTFTQLTKRFSMEFAIRPFLKKYPQETLKYVKEWSKDPNYHVRRFASEGIRPNLPWGGKVNIGLENILGILDALFTDHTQYVLRSVANNLNDITKIDSQIVINTLIKWKQSNKQSEKNITFLIQHALRTEIKLGNPKALSLLGYTHADIKIDNFLITTPQVYLGESLKFNFEITSHISQKLLIHYHLHFVTAKGKTSAKVFQIGKKALLSGENKTYHKKHPLKKMTTKKLYSGKHFIEIIINGQSYDKKSFYFNNTSK